MLHSPGIWRIDRRIEDRRAGTTGLLQGTAELTPDGPGLIYSEEGILRIAGQPGLTARQSYLWRADGDGIEVLFADGRPFHRIGLIDAAPEASHDCAPDIYCVRYDFARWPDWRAVWQVTGPRKDYTMTTEFQR